MMILCTMTKLCWNLVLRVRFKHNMFTEIVNVKIAARTLTSDLRLSISTLFKDACKTKKRQRQRVLRYPKTASCFVFVQRLRLREMSQDKPKIKFMCRKKKKKKKEVPNQEHWLRIGWSASFASLHFPAD